MLATLMARATVANWENANGALRPLRVAMPRGYGARIFFARLRADLATVGIDIERVTVDRPHDLLLVDRTAQQSTPAWYLDQLSCNSASASPNNCARIALSVVRRASATISSARGLQIVESLQDS